MKKSTSTVASLVLAAILAPSAYAQGVDYGSVLTRFSGLRSSNSDSLNGRWVQPVNRTEECQLYMWGTPDPTSTLKWFGDCRNGRALGLGVIVSASSQSGTSVALEEYGTGDGSDTVTYRQVSVSPQMKVISKGRVLPGSRLVTVTSVDATARGNPVVTLGGESCRGGECTRRRVDPLTGSMLYEVSGVSGYTILWNDQRADNQTLFTRRMLSMDGSVPFEKFVVDGEVYDLYSDTRSGQRGRVIFSDEVNAVLALPIEQFSAISNDLQMAVQESDEKFASVYERFCRGQKDPDVRLLCDPSGLVPKEEELAAARAENNEWSRTSYQQFKNNAAAANAQAAQMQAAQMQQHQLQAQQQALAAERQRQANQEALRRGFEAINQAGQEAQRAGQQMMQSYGAPQVRTPTLNTPSIVHCRTIGYITTCN